MTVSQQLTVLSEASRLLAAAQTVDDVKAIRDKAEAARVYVRAARLGLELQNHAAEVRLRAERKAGGMLQAMKLRGGDRKSKARRAPLKLEELGITRDQSKRWQRIAAVPESVFLKYMKAMNEHDHEITSAGLLRTARCHCQDSVQATPTHHDTPVVESEWDAEATFQELMNHCQLLQNIVRPAEDDSKRRLKDNEHRIVGRVVREIAELIAQLKKAWPRRERF